MPQEVGEVSLKLETSIGNTKIRICDDAVRSPEEQAEILKRLGKLLGGEAYYAGPRASAEVVSG